MYQFYYSENKPYERGLCNGNVKDYIEIESIKPSMWEEHCLECSAPLCYKNCLNYVARSDGRCKRFDNSFQVYQSDKACCGKATHIKFRKWANMMTIVFPAMLSISDYKYLFNMNEKLGNLLKKIVCLPLPSNIKWQIIRTIEFTRRRFLRKMTTSELIPNAFVFHGYSYNQNDYNLIVEVYDDHTPLFKTSMKMNPGENLIILDKTNLSFDFIKANNLIKIYPENNVEAELDILWCDFVRGTIISQNSPSTKVKCLVWDLDNTLWGGILIETDNPNTLNLRDGVLDTIKALDARGIIQSIASKNDFEVAWPVIERLGISEFFLYPQINWGLKSNSLNKIAASLNIGIDSLALVDDSIFERNEVSINIPNVRVYDEKEIPTLLNYEEFNVKVTNESKNRRKMYQVEQHRNELLEDSSNSVEDFIRKCNLQIEYFAPKTEEEILRCYELIVRTNQLNLSGKKYTQEEFNEIFNKENHENFAFRCKDDFGEYGIVGFGQYFVQENHLNFTEFAMSCRVAGKYVESSLFSNLLKKENCVVGTFKVNKTKKNILLRRTLSEIGFTINSEKKDMINYIFNNNLKNKDLVKFLERK